MPASSIVMRGDPVADYEDFRAGIFTDPSAEYSFSSYGQDDRAKGGYWGMSFTLHARLNLLMEMFENGLGREVEVWDHQLEQIFEGQVHELVFHIPPNVYTTTREQISNRMRMRADSDADGEPERSTLLEDTDSQERFGILEQTLSGGEVPSVTEADQATQIAINLKAWPKPEIQLGRDRGRQAAHLEVFCRGYIWMFSRRVYNQTALTGTQAAQAQVQDVVDTIGTYIATLDKQQNPTATDREHDIDRFGADLVFGIGDMGDSDHNRWQFLMFGHRFTQAVGRAAFFKPFAPPAR